MPNPRLAARYAKSIIDLATEQNLLETVYNDMKFLQAACKQSRELVNLLQSPIIHADKKNAILTAITANAKLNNLSQSFVQLLINKGREAELPEIAKAVIEQYNILKGIHTVKLTTAVEISDSIKNSITAQIKSAKNIQSIELETVVDDKLIGGFVLEFDGKILDASIVRELHEIKKHFAQNDYVMKMY